MSETIEELLLELSIDSGNFNKEMKQIDNAIKKSENNFKNASKMVEDYEDSYVGLNHKIEKTTTQINLYNKKLERQESQHSELTEIIEKQKIKLNELEKTLGKGSDEWKKQAALIQNNGQKLVNLSNNIEKTKNSIKLLENNLSETKEKFNSLGEETESFKDKLKALDDKLSKTESELGAMISANKKAEGSYGALAQEILQLGAKLEVGSQKINLYKSEIATLEKNLKLNKQELNELSNSILQTNNKLEQAKVKYGENSQEAQKLSGKLLSLKDDYRKLNLEINDSEKELSDFKQEMNNIQKEVNETSKEISSMKWDKLSEDLDNAKSKAETLRNSLVGLGLGSGMALLEADKTITQFEGSLGLTQEEAEELYGLLSDYAKDGFGMEGMSEITKKTRQEMSDLFKGNTKEAENFEKGIYSICEVMDVDYDETIRAAQQLMRNYGISGEKALDIIAKGFQNGLNSSGDYLDMLHEYPVQFASLGFSAEETFQILERGAKSGVYNLDHVSDAIKEARLVLSEMPKDTEEALKSIGFNASAVKKAINEGGEASTKMILKIIDKMNTLDKTTQNQVGLTIFRTKWEDTGGAVQNILSGLNGQVEGLDGSVNQVRESFEESFGAKLTGKLQELKEPLLQIAEVGLIPILDVLGDIITKFSEWFSTLDKGSIKALVGLGLFTIVLPTILGMLSNLITIGRWVAPMFSSMGTSALNSKNAISLLAGKGGLIGLAVVLILIASLLGESENAILKFQEKLGGLGFVIGALCEFTSGVVQLTVGQIITLILGLCDIIQAIFDGPGGKTVSDAWSRMNNKLVLNTEEAYSKIFLKTSIGMSQLQELTSSQLTVLNNTAKGLLEQIPLIVDGNYGEAAKRMSYQLGSLNQNQLNILSNMNDTTRTMFQGINTSMTVEEKANQIEWNLKQMSEAGRINGEAMSKDISEAMETFSRILKEKSKEGSETVNTNTKQMASETENNAEEMKETAITNANSMKIGVTNATATMRDRCISDWNSIRGAYSRNITGSVSIMKTTTNIQRTQSFNEPQIYSLNNNLARAFSIPKINPENYALEGAYYTRNSSESVELIEKNIALNLNSLKKLITPGINSISKNEINVYLEKIEIKNGDDYQVAAKKLANMLNIELEKLKKKNKRTKGGGIYA